jgi:hypothetical protein
MSRTVQIALVGDPANPGDRIPESEWAKSWNEHPRLDFGVEDRETLASIVERALPAFGVDLSKRDIAPVHIVDVVLYRGEDELTRPLAGTFSVVDDDGRVLWSAYDLRLIPYEQLRRSVDAGAIEGDPERLYLILKEPVGDGIGVDWPTLVEAVKLMWAIADHVATAGGAAWALKAIGGALRERLRRGEHAVAENAHRWAQRGAWPGTFARFLRRETWSSTTLADLLGCSVEDAEALLGLFGFAYSDEDGLWHKEGDAAGRVLAALYRETELTRFELSTGEREEFEARVEHLLTTGHSLPEPTFDFDEPQPTFELASFAMTSEGIAGQATIGGRQVQMQIPIEELELEQIPQFNALFDAASRLIRSEAARFGADTQREGDDDHREEPS